VELELLHNLAIALGLGLLVGFERERTAPETAGVRTFALITVLGALMAVLARDFGAGVLAVSVAAVVAFLLMSNVLQLRSRAPDPGITTEIAALVMFGVGATAAAGYRIVAAVLAGSVTVLLHWKRPLHALAERIGEAEFKAAMRLVLIGLVILPIVPDRTFGPYGIINPFQIWLMVVLIVGISMAGYVAYKVLGARRGTLLGGILGGLISSTAATVGYARRAREAPAESGAAAAMILIASAVVFGRVLFEIGVVAPSQLRGLGPPIAAMLLAMVALSAASFRLARTAIVDTVDRAPPSDLRAAIVLGLLYGGVLFLLAAAKQRFGTGGLFVVAGLSGLTDMDAITLSTAALVRAGQIDPSLGWRAILVAGLANLLFKGAAVAALGPRSLARRVGGLFLAAFLFGAALIAFGP